MNEDESAEVTFPLAVCGFHIYHGVWIPQLGQQVSAGREHCNTEDRFAAVVLDMKVPRQMSKLTPASSLIAPSRGVKTALTNPNIIYFL